MAHGEISDKNVRFGLIFPRELKAALSEIAVKENRTLSNLIITILSNYVKDYPKEES